MRRVFSIRPIAIVVAQLTSCAPAGPSSPSAVVAPPSVPARVELDNSDRSVAAEVRDRALATSKAYSIVESLVDSVGPRLAGSIGEKASVEWGVKTLGALGFESVHAEPVTTPHWERGDESAELVAPYPHRFAVAALGGSEATAPEGVEGEILEVGSLEEIDALPAEAVKGKIVFFHRVMKRTHDGTGYGDAVSVRGGGATHASKLGARAVVIRSIGTDGNRLAHTGALHYDEGVAPIPAAAISTPDADLLDRLVTASRAKEGPSAGKPVRVRLKLGARTLPAAETGANVVGEVVGREKPGEIVLVGAHLDSWDLGQGALDDGAGCAIAIEALRQISMAPQKPRRTVRVVLFANEENGLAGAKAYALAHAMELDRHVLAMEADLGADRVYAARFLGAVESRTLFQDLARVLRPLSIAIDDEPAHGGADLIPLIPLGVPFVDLRQDASRYFDVHHTANDTLDKIDRPSLDQVVAAYAGFLYAVADAPQTFGRVPEELRKRP